MSSIETQSTSSTTALVPRQRRGRTVDTIKVRVAPLATPEATATAIGQLIEDWSALTYTCMVEAATPAANEPMQPMNEHHSDAVGAA
jgi:hypothetical protein